jgi:hypothetical protein
MARHWHRAAREKPVGCNPVGCEAIKGHAVDNTRRMSCTRYGACLTWATSTNHPAWTCAYCGVRETVKLEAPVRQGSTGEDAEYPKRFF